MTNTIDNSTQKFIDTIEKSTGGPSLDMALGKIGKNSMEHAKRSRETMQNAAVKVLPEMNSDSPLAKTVLEANMKITELNPNSLSEKLLYKIPIPSVKNWMVKKYISGFQTQNQQVQGIFEALERGKDSLLMKMIELEHQYNDLKITDAELVNDIDVGKGIQKYLESIDTNGLEQSEVLKYNSASNRVARRVRDLTTIRSAIQQFFVSINQTMETQSLLNDTIDSIQQVGPLVLQNAIMINSAINEQKQVANAANIAQQSLASAMEQNAALIKDNATNVAEMYNNPVIALESFKKSYDDLREAINITNTAMNQSTENAKQMTQELEHMQLEFKDVENNLESSVKAKKQLDARDSQNSQETQAIENKG